MKQPNKRSIKAFNELAIQRKLIINAVESLNAAIFQVFDAKILQRVVLRIFMIKLHDCELLEVPDLILHSISFLK